MADDYRIFARDLFQQAVFLQPNLTSPASALSSLNRSVYLLVPSSLA